MAERVLLTFLGIGQREAEYALDGRVARASHAAVAWCALQPVLRPDRIVVLVTPEAREASLPGLQEACRAAGLPAPEDRPLRDPNDLDASMTDLVDAVPRGAELWVDLTHAFRHLALFAQAAAALLEHTKGVRVAGLAYGVMNGPLLELEPLFELPRWLVAVRSFVDTGSTAELAAVVDPAGRKDPQALEVAVALRAFDRAWRSGLPLEAGQAAATLVRGKKPLGRVLRARPFTAGLREELLRGLESLTCAGDGQAWKGRVAFDAAEEARQWRIVERYVAAGQLAQAAAVAREWVVSKAVPPGEAWLEKEVRSAAERRLGALVARDELGLVADEAARALAADWRLLRDELRNYLMHAGMRPGVHPLEQGAAIVRALGRWAGSPLPLPPAPSGVRLLTPVGLAPGSLFTALRRLGAEGPAPEAVFVVGSAGSLPGAREAARQAGFAGPIETWEVADPFSDYGAMLRELERLRKDPGAAGLRFVAEAGALVVNLAGGTTLLGVAVEGLARIGRELGVATRRFAVADRRPPREQQERPWVEGELHWLDGPTVEAP